LFAVVEHRTGCRLAAQRDCDFSSSGAPVEHYTGTMTRIGLDIGVTTSGAIIWAVFADTDGYAGMLTGTYAGASGEVSIAAGLGANVLVGGSNTTVALQPVSVQDQVGLNVAAGVGALELHTPYADLWAAPDSNPGSPRRAGRALAIVKSTGEGGFGRGPPRL
jgi:hypothetical protein